MTLIEQAVFTSARTERSDGYQVVARSQGVLEADARELAVWGPSHESMLDSGLDAASVNFHPLPSGAFCVSRTTPAGWEYSGRGGHRVYTHCLIVPPDALERFANNPFSLMRAAVARGLMEVPDGVPDRLEPVALPGGTSAVDQELLARLAVNPGPERMAALVQLSLNSACLAIAGGSSPEDAIAGAINCLPVSCRAEFSFCTGLKFSSRRPFRIIALSDDKAGQRWLSQKHNVAVFDLSAEAAQETVPLDGWAQLIKRALSACRISMLAGQLANISGRKNPVAKAADGNPVFQYESNVPPDGTSTNNESRADLSIAELSALGLQLLEEMESSDFRPRQDPDRSTGQLRSGQARPEQSRPEHARVEKTADWSIARELAHAAHYQFLKSKAVSDGSKVAASAPSKSICPHSVAAQEKLEHLDDVVFEALNGDEAAAGELQTLWPAVLLELGEAMVAESREQYLRYALAIWEQCVSTDGVRDPARAVQALDVLCLLFNET
jgi:hypothetical protein